jgi:hypothetical protein
MTERRQTPKPVPFVASPVVTRWACASLGVIAVAVIAVSISGANYFDVPWFQALLCALFNLSVAGMSGVSLWQGCITQRILWGGWRTVSRDTDPNWFWISWWGWLIGVVGTVEFLFIAHSFLKLDLSWDGQ